MLTFPLAESMQSHSKLHDTESCVFCSICDYQANKSFNLKRHYKLKHGVNEEDVVITKDAKGKKYSEFKKFDKKLQTLTRATKQQSDELNERKINRKVRNETRNIYHVRKRREKEEKQLRLEANLGIQQEQEVVIPCEGEEGVSGEDLEDVGQVEKEEGIQLLGLLPMEDIIEETTDPNAETDKVSVPLKDLIVEPCTQSELAEVGILESQLEKERETSLEGITAQNSIHDDDRTNIDNTVLPISPSKIDEHTVAKQLFSIVKVNPTPRKEISTKVKILTNTGKPKMLPNHQKCGQSVVNERESPQKNPIVSISTKAPTITQIKNLKPNTKVIKVETSIFPRDKHGNIDFTCKESKEIIGNVLANSSSDTKIQSSPSPLPVPSEAKAFTDQGQKRVVVKKVIVHKPVSNQEITETFSKIKKEIALPAPSQATTQPKEISAGKAKPPVRYITQQVDSKNIKKASQKAVAAKGSAGNVRILVSRSQNEQLAKAGGRGYVSIVRKPSPQKKEVNVPSLSVPFTGINVRELLLESDNEATSGEQVTLQSGNVDKGEVQSIYLAESGQDLQNVQLIQTTETNLGHSGVNPDVLDLSNQDPENVRIIQEMIHALQDPSYVSKMTSTDVQNLQDVYHQLEQNEGSGTEENSTTLLQFEEPVSLITVPQSTEAPQILPTTTLIDPPSNSTIMIPQSKESLESLQISTLSSTSSSTVEVIKLSSGATLQLLSMPNSALSQPAQNTQSATTEMITLPGSDPLQQVPVPVFNLGQVPVTMPPQYEALASIPVTLPPQYSTLTSTPIVSPPKYQDNKR